MTDRKNKIIAGDLICAVLIRYSNVFKLALLRFISKECRIESDFTAKRNDLFPDSGNDLAQAVCTYMRVSIGSREQMDRFLVRISVGYPTAETELEILRAHRGGRPIDSLTAVTTPEAILKTRSEVQKIHIDEALERYVISLVQATRNDGGVRLAASPRAGMNLVRMAQACAFVDGRDFVNPDDIQRVFFPVMEHRVFAKDTGNPEASKKILQNS